MENLKDINRILDQTHVDASFTQAASVADNVTLLLASETFSKAFTKNHFSPIQDKSCVNKQFSCAEYEYTASKLIASYRLAKIQGRKCGFRGYERTLSAPWIFVLLDSRCACYYRRCTYHAHVYAHMHAYIHASSRVFVSARQLILSVTSVFASIIIDDISSNILPRLTVLVSTKFQVLYKDEQTQLDVN